MVILRSIVFNLFYALSTIFFFFISVLLWILPFPWRYRILTHWANLNLFVLRWVCGVRVEVEGRENIPNQPSVIMCKHQSAWETLALQKVFPMQTWVLKKELIRVPFFGWGIASLKPIAIDRKAGRKALEQVVIQGKDRLGRGIWVVIFPEGTRMPIKQMGRFGIGGARLASEVGVPVVPVAHNAGHVWPKGSFVKHAGVIKLIVGQPISSEGRTDVELNQQVSDWMSETMSKIE